MNIYFAGSIRAGLNDVDLYKTLIEHLKKYGNVLTEHVGDEKLTKKTENLLSDKQIHDRDIEWLLNSDVLVAEVTTPSLGVGYEIARAVEHNLSILCLYRPQEGKKLSAMIKGSATIINHEYSRAGEAKTIIDSFMNNLS